MLKEIRKRVEDIVGEDGNEITVRTVKEELIGELDGLVRGIRRRIED